MQEIGIIANPSLTNWTTNRGYSQKSHEGFMLLMRTDGVNRTECNWWCQSNGSSTASLNSGQYSLPGGSHQLLLRTRQIRYFPNEITPVRWAEWKPTQRKYEYHDLPDTIHILHQNKIYSISLGYDSTQESVKWKLLDISIVGILKSSGTATSPFRFNGNSRKTVVTCIEQFYYTECQSRLAHSWTTCWGRQVKG